MAMELLGCDETSARAIVAQWTDSGESFADKLIELAKVGDSDETA